MTRGRELISIVNPQAFLSRHWKTEISVSSFISLEMNGGDAYGAVEAQYIRRHHRHQPRENQCTSALVKHIKAPVHLVSFIFFSIYTSTWCFLFLLFRFFTSRRILVKLFLFFWIWWIRIGFGWFCSIYDILAIIFLTSGHFSCNFLTTKERLLPAPPLRKKIKYRRLFFRCMLEEA